MSTVVRIEGIFLNRPDKVLSFYIPVYTWPQPSFWLIKNVDLTVIFWICKITNFSTSFSMGL